MDFLWFLKEGLARKKPVAGEASGFREGELG